MAILKRFTNWLTTPAKYRRLLREAAFELLRARLLVAFSLRRSLPALLLPAAAATPVPSRETQIEVSHSIRIAAGRVPWKSLCLPNAIAAKRMLERRGFASTMRLGVGRREAGDLHAHAWLEVDGKILIGGDGMAGISPLPLAMRAQPAQGARFS